MRVVAFVQDPLFNAGPRCRIAALAPGLRARGINLRVLPPAGDRFARWARRGGPARRLIYYARVILGRLWSLPRAARADAVIIFRSMVPVGPPWMEALVRLLNRNLILDMDDALFLRPPFATGGYRFVHLDAPARVLRRARAAVVGSPWLAEFALRHCDIVRVIPTCLDTAHLPARADAPGDPLVVGWIGTRGGFHYLHALDDVWRDLQRRHGVVFRVVSNGPYEAEGLEVDNIPWSQEGETDLLRSFDIGIMPLPDSPFERCKAGFKLLQYLAVGSAAVASPVGVNRGICGGAEERGLIADSPDEWRSKLDRLITDADLRRRLGRAGREFVHARYDVSGAVEAWADLLHEVIGIESTPSPRTGEVPLDGVSPPE